MAPVQVAGWSQSSSPVETVTAFLASASVRVGWPESRAIEMPGKSGCSGCETGNCSRVAAYGGTTTLLHFVYARPGDSLVQKVEEMLFSLIPTDRRNQLLEEEWFHLLASTWLHDIGMILDLFGRSEDFKKVRDTHHERSAEYIAQNRDTLGLTPHEAFIIAQICRYHRKKNDIVIKAIHK